jgi:hypothetical protein
MARKKEKNKKPEKKGFFRKLSRFILKLFIIVLVTAVILNFCINNTAVKSPLNCTSDSGCMDSMLNQQNGQGQGLPEILKPLFKANLQETVKCVNNLCDVYMIRESDQCMENERLKAITITIKSIIPPSMALSLIRQIISTKQLPTLESLQNLK